MTLRTTFPLAAVLLATITFTVFYEVDRLPATTARVAEIKSRPSGRIEPLPVFNSNNPPHKPVSSGIPLARKRQRQTLQIPQPRALCTAVPY